jgi:hypothetical protein
LSRFGRTFALYDPDCEAQGMAILSEWLNARGRKLESSDSKVFAAPKDGLFASVFAFNNKTSEDNREQSIAVNPRPETTWYWYRHAPDQ